LAARHRAGLALVFVGVGLDLDVAADDVGIILQVVSGLQDIFFLGVLDAFDLHIHVLRRGRHLLGTLVLGDVAAAAARARLFDRLLRSTFRADGGRLGQVVEAGAACDADPLNTEFRLSHESIRPFVIGYSPTRRS
jgi:hypothetical protein